MHQNSVVSVKKCLHTWSLIFPDPVLMGGSYKIILCVLCYCPKEKISIDQYLQKHDGK